MQLFVTGATGVLGKAVVPSLLADGHVVYALSRSEANKEVLQRLGAKPVSADLFDSQALVQVLAGCEAEAILHLATSIPPTMQVGRLSAWQENDRIRREGARALVEAALAAGTVRTFIFPSYAFVYPDSGDRWIDAETTPVQPAVNLYSTLDAEAEVARFAGNERRGISLRMGAFYGPEPTSWQLLRYARRLTANGAYKKRYNLGRAIGDVASYGLIDTIETICQRLASYEAVGAQELVIHFSDATHLDAVRRFARAFIA